ncbi:MAG TPA: hypothetical protein VLK85_05655 [Ramlibacter sp.]|nr:hypothetical protein [Ramlibacter sp.]
MKIRSTWPLLTSVSAPTQVAFALHGKGNGYLVHRDYLAGKIDMEPVLATARRIQISDAPELEHRYPASSLPM